MVCAHGSFDKLGYKQQGRKRSCGSWKEVWEERFSFKIAET